jgi:hypothetical protein
MKQVLIDCGKRCADLLLHWSVAGIILALWGLTPEDVIANVLRGAPVWILNQGARLPFLLIGIGLISWDIFARLRHSKVNVHNQEYNISHNSDGTSDVEGWMTFPYNPAQFNLKVRLPRFKSPPKITLFSASGDSSQPHVEAEVDNFVAQVTGVEPEKAKRTYKWVAHGVLLNGPASAH